MARVYWDDVEIGDSLPVADMFLSADQVRSYATTAGMAAPRFTDEEGARREGLPGIIAPGNMTMGLLRRRLTEWNDSIVLHRLGVTFRGFVVPEQAIRIHGNIIAKDETDAGRTTLELDLWVETASGDRVVTGTATIGIPRRNA